MTKDRTKALLRDRMTAYARVFNSDDPAAKAVLDDLKRFCRAQSTCFHPDPRVHAALEGRREVVLRILDHTTLSFDELCARYAGLGASDE